jgi:hypothetical protein
MTSYNFIGVSGSTLVDWSDPSGWAQGSVPNSTSADVVFSNIPFTPFSQCIIASSENFAVDSVSVGASLLSITGSLSVTNAFTVTSGGVLAIGGSLTAGSLSLSGSASGFAIGGTGTITITGQSGRDDDNGWELQQYRGDAAGGCR